MTALRASIRSAVFSACAGLAACATVPQHGPSAVLNGSTRLHIAEAAEQSGDYQTAANLLAAAAAEAPGDAEVQLRFADLLARRGQVQQARDVLRARLKTVSDPARLESGLAGLDVLTGATADAIGMYDTLLKANPGDVRLLTDKGVALDVAGQHAAAQALYRQALAATPGDPVALSDLGLSLALSGQPEEARRTVAPLVGNPALSERIRNNVAVIQRAGSSTTPDAEPAPDTAVASLAGALSNHATGE